MEQYSGTVEWCRAVWGCEKDKCYIIHAASLFSYLALTERSCASLLAIRRSASNTWKVPCKWRVV